MTTSSRAAFTADRNLGLDIARASAIVMVMICHYGNLLLFWLRVPNPERYPAPGGFFGVELFFVLSGFLIGRILLEIARTQPSPRALGIFLVRRWMRTLPLYLIWLVVVWSFLPYVHVSPSYVLRYLTLTQNLFWPMPDDHFFAVSWSLTVEEWFYLLFGSGVILCAAFVSRRTAIWLPIALFLIVPLALRWLTPDNSPLMADIRRVAVLRLDAIAYGAAMAAISLYRPHWIARPLLLLGIGAVLAVAAWENVLGLLLSWHLATILMLNLSSLGLVLMLPAAVQVQRAPRWFAAPVRMIAAQSYGLYIMHLTFLDLAFWVNGTWPWINKPTAWLGSLVIPFVLSWLSFRYFETPILRMRPSQRLRFPVTGADVAGLDQRMHSAGDASPVAQQVVVGANRD